MPPLLGRSLRRAAHARRRGGGGGLEGLEVPRPPHHAHTRPQYLGQTITFHNASTTEIQHRIRAAWACFTGHRQELTSKHYPLEHRLRIYRGTVIPTMMYGAETWTPPEPLQHQLRRTQRRMVRAIIGSPRRRTTTAPPTRTTPTAASYSHDHDGHDNTPSDSSDHDASSNPPTPTDPPPTSEGGSDASQPTQTQRQTADDVELWSDYIRRSTRRAEELMSSHDIPDATQLHRKTVWRWAARVATHSPGRWTQRALNWNPNLDTKQQ